jgi:dTDP-4-amino-4,6-dideoxygalactose transaminase
MSDTFQVPLLDLKAQYATIRGEVEKAVQRVLEAQGFILGPEVEALEREMADYGEVEHAVGCASGSDALLLALMACGVGPGDQVVCPAYTFFATAGSIARLGAVPVFADIDPTTYNLDVQRARTASEGCKRLKALLPVHLFGQAADLDGFLALGRDLAVPVIEAAAQAIGTRDAAGRRVGSRGAIGCFSFFPSKNLGAYGDGGLLTTKDAESAERLRVLRVHGSQPKYVHKRVGINSRLDALQAAVLRVKLSRLDGWSEARRHNARYYDRAFQDAGAQPSSVPLGEGGLPLRTPLPPAEPAVHSYNQYVIRTRAELRDGLRQHLLEQKIGTEIYYPIGLHLQECFAALGYRPGSLPQTESAARETLALPIYPELTRAQQDYVVGSILAFLRR